MPTYPPKMPLPACTSSASWIEIWVFRKQLDRLSIRGFIYKTSGVFLFRPSGQSVGRGGSGKPSMHLYALLSNYTPISARSGGDHWNTWTYHAASVEAFRCRGLLVDLTPTTSGCIRSKRAETMLLHDFSGRTKSAKYRYSLIICIAIHHAES